MSYEEGDFCIYLIASSCFTGDAGITAGHYFNIFSNNHHTCGIIISREAAKRWPGEGSREKKKSVFKILRVIFFLWIVQSGLRSPHTQNQADDIATAL